MERRIWDKQIPSILGILIIVIGLSVTTFLTSRQTFVQTGASETAQPQEVRITNLSESSFTVSYITDAPAGGYINYGSTGSLGQTAFDERDISQKLQNHTIHSFILKNLIPSTRYYFQVISGQGTYLNNNHNFEIVTAPSVPFSPTVNEISGKIILPNASPPGEAIVYISTANSQTLSTLAASDGTYQLNLNHLLTSDLSKLSDLSKNPQVQMLIIGGLLSSNVEFNYKASKIVPVVTLSNNYDFRENASINSDFSASFGSFSDINSKPAAKTKGGQLLNLGNNQVFSNQKPIIYGRAGPKASVQITIHSDEEIQTTVSADQNGNWSYQPTIPLSPGTHTITVTAKDTTGTLKTITQNFTISPTQASPTQIPNTGSQTASKARLTPAATKQALPSSGNSSILTAGIIGLLITVVGGLIFLLTRKGI